MTEEIKPSVELDEILTRAVDRQIAEQRALRQTLDELRDGVRELAERPAARIDLSPLEERIRSLLDITALEERMRSIVDPTMLEDRLRSIVDPTILEDRIRTIIESANRASSDNVRSVVEASVLGASESTFASISEQLRSFREAVVPRIEQGAEAGPEVHAIREELAAVREVVGGVSSDLEGIAQALIDFNAGLRQWASGLDESVTSIRLTVGDLYAVATQVAPSETAIEKPLTVTDATAPGRAVSGEPEEPKAMEERIKETAELSEYLADQIEDLDGLMGRLTELPVQLEGVVSQALKRTLTARAKLDKEAETALDDVLESLDEHVNQLSEVIGRFEQEEDHIRKLALEQVELSSRIESLQETFVDRVDRFDTERRRGEEALAVAIDRSARGLSPRALESLSKSTKRRKATPPRAGAKAKAKAKAKAEASRGRRRAPAKTEAKSQPKRKAKRSRSRKAKRPDWTPLPSASDETPE